MLTEPTELAEARALLERFEAEMRQPEGLVHLSEALSLLVDVRAGGASDKIAQIASNLALAYAKRVAREVEPLIAQESPIHMEIVGHWWKVFAEFDRSGFTLPQDVTEVREKFWQNVTGRVINQMSPAERKELLERLQAMNDDRGL